MDISFKLEENFRLNSNQKLALTKLGIKTVEDLLYYFPNHYGDFVESRNISSLEAGETVTIFGKISKLKTSKAFKSKMPMGEGVLTDDTGSIKIVWFNQPYLAKMISNGTFVRAQGKVSKRKNSTEIYISNPQIEKIDKLPIAVGDSLFQKEKNQSRLYPVYPETRGISSNWIYHTIKEKIFEKGILDSIVDPIPKKILEEYNLPTLKTALIWIHTPEKENDAKVARKRFAFEEVFLIQLERQKERKEWAKNQAFVIEPKTELLEKFISRFPFKFTEAQNTAIKNIFADFKKGHAMARLLEGDVGSGKTAVAATTAYATIMTRPKDQNYGSLQVAYMAPTEILASQHFESFIEYFAHTGVSIGLITGSGARKFPSKVNPRGWTDISKNQLLKWVESGEIAILIGTHALIQKTVKWKNLAYVIIDEQHRFGTAQRQKLVRKDKINPHLLSMTATPIPRTLALTIYGDLDITLLDQMPVGRKTIITEIVRKDEREKMYEKIKKELETGRQAYIICPRIDEPDPTKELAVLAKSVKEEAKRLKKNIFSNYEIGILHSKMKDSEKEKSMNDFKIGKTQILVATSVVEVGVNVQNATVILIEGAERFGLSQLHQLRGRVIRSNHQAYCFLFAESHGDKTRDRLRALTTAKNGFELAEHDLRLRGAGELYSGKQWGISDVAMEAIQNIKMVEMARKEALALVYNDDTFADYPLLKKELEKREKQRIHFE